MDNRELKAIEVAFIDVSTRILIASAVGLTDIEYIFSSDLNPKEVESIIKYLTKRKQVKITHSDNGNYLIDWKHFSIKKGDKVRYVGTGLPKYTGKILKVKNLLEKGLRLELPDQKDSVTIIDGVAWENNSMLCGYGEVEVLE